MTDESVTKDDAAEGASGKDAADGEDSAALAAQLKDAMQRAQVGCGFVQ